LQNGYKVANLRITEIVRPTVAFATQLIYGKEENTDSRLFHNSSDRNRRCRTTIQSSTHYRHCSYPGLCVHRAGVHWSRFVVF
jgi:hypothetical protein